MNFAEALVLVNQGVKVTRSCWGEDNYLRIEDNQLRTKHGAVPEHDFRVWLKSDDWQKYQEPLRVRIGDRIKMLSSGNEYIVAKIDKNAVLVNLKSGTVWSDPVEFPFGGSCSIEKFDILKNMGKVVKL